MKQANYNSPWLNVLQHFLQAFMEFCLPEASAEIDWCKGYIPLDKELHAVSRQQKIGKRIADALFQVWLKSGEEVWLLVHIEVQGQKEAYFPERMYVYNYRIFDRYHKQVMSVAILTDSNPHWRPTTYERSALCNKLRFEFATIKLLDYAHQKEMLAKQDNPFAIIILAHLVALETRKDADFRLQSKVKVTRALYKRGFSKEYILNLFAFIDWILALPEPLELEYTHYIEQLEKEKRVNYITSVERIGIQKGIAQGIEKGMEQGIEKGIQKGEATIFLKLIQCRFGNISKSYKRRIMQTDANTLLILAERILEAQTVEDLFEGHE